VRHDKVHVFGGATVQRALADGELILHGPARRGDFHSLIGGDQPRSVLFVDSTMFHLPAPEHRELLDLIESGVPVVGCGCAGALRAAELRSFGMHGTGMVYDSVVEGRITDDGELAVTMLADIWEPLTVSLFAVRWFLSTVVRRASLDPSMASKLLDSARRIYFMDRTADRLSVEWNGIGGDEVIRLTRRFPLEQFDPKPHDALAGLRMIESLLVGAIAPGPSGAAEIMWNL
jgi:hypothetical protein